MYIVHPVVVEGQAGGEASGTADIFFEKKKKKKLAEKTNS